MTRRYADVTLTLTLDLCETPEAFTVGPRKFSVRAADPFDFEDDLREATHVFFADRGFVAFVEGLADKYADDYLTAHLCATATVHLAWAGGERRDVAIGNPFAVDFAEDIARAVRTLWRGMNPPRDRVQRNERGDWTGALFAGIVGLAVGRRLQKPAAERGPRIDCLAGCGAPLGDAPLLAVRKVKCGLCDGHGCPCCDGTGEHDFGEVCSAARRDDRQASLDRAAAAADRDRAGLYLVRGALDQAAPTLDERNGR